MQCEENIKKKFQDAKAAPGGPGAGSWTPRTGPLSARPMSCAANRNALSKQVGMLMGQAKKDPSKLEEAEAVKAQVKANADRLA